MASGIQVSTDAIPAIAKLFGFSLPDDSQNAPQPPLQAAQNAPDPSGQSDPMPALQDAQGGKEPTKLEALQRLLNPGAANLPPMQSAQNPAIPSGPTPQGPQPADSAPPMSVQGAPPVAPLPSGIANPPSGEGQVDPTFKEAHPKLAAFLKGALQFVQNAGPGIGAKTFGEGFQTASEQPFIRAQQQQAIQKGAADVAHTKAVTNQLQSEVTLPNGLTVPFAMAQKLYPTLLTEQGKNTRNTANLDSKESIAGDKNALAMRKQGLKPNPNDPTGSPVPIGYDEMSPSEQAHYDLLQSQKDATDARADLERSKNDVNSPSYKLALGRLQTAQKNANTAVGRLGLSKDTFNANFFGTGPDGQALPGAPIDEATGKPIGPRVANSGKTPAERLKRGDLAANAIGNLDSVDKIVADNPNLVGAIAGRFTTVKQMIGSDDPAISRIGVAVHNYALASNGAHGVRSQGAVEKTENEILNHFKSGVNAIHGGIQEAKGSLQMFVDDAKLGSRPTQGPKNTAKAKDPLGIL